MIYQFSPYRLDVSQRELHHNGQPVEVEPKVFDMLVCLISHRDHVLSKDDLMDKVWHGLIVSEATISGRIKAARQAVGDNGKAQKRIKTYHGRGFRFVADVSELTIDDTESAPLLSANLNGFRGEPHLGAETKTALPLLAQSSRASIVILPFQNMTADPEQAYFADGVVEEITTVLYQIGELEVVSRSSAFSYKDKNLDIRQIAKELNVRYVVEGSIRKAGQQLRITAQLIDALTNKHLWANNYDNQEGDLFAFQDQIATSVASILTSTILSSEISRLRKNGSGALTSEDYVLQGYDLLMSQSDRNFKEAADCFIQALKTDPGNMRAAALVSYCLSIKIIYFMSENPAEDRQKALALAEQALQTVGDDVVALTSIAAVYSGISQDQPRANMLVNRVLSVSPNLPQAWILKGYITTRSGQPKTGIEHFKKALSLAPRENHVHFIYTGLSIAYFFDANYKSSLEWAEKARIEQPHNPSSLMMMAVTAHLCGNEKLARHSMTHFLKIVPSNISIQKVLERGVQMPDFVNETFLSTLRALGIPG